MRTLAAVLAAVALAGVAAASDAAAESACADIDATSAKQVLASCDAIIADPAASSLIKAAAIGHRAVWLSEPGGVAAALVTVEQALAAAPTEPGLLRARAVVLYGLDRGDEAVAAYGLAIKADPRAGVIYYERGETLYQLGRHQEALADFVRTTDLEPENAKAWAWRARARLESDTPEAALNEIAQAERLAKIGEVYEIKAEVLKALGRKPQALTAYDEAVRLSPTVAILRTERGDLEAEMGMAKEAIADFRGAIAMGEDLDNAYKGLAFLELRAGRADRAVAAFDPLLKQQPDDFETLQTAAALMLSAKRYDRAIALLDKIILADPKGGKHYADRGMVWESKGDYARAVADATVAVTLTPKDDRFLVDRARYEIVLKRLPDARADLDAAIALNPKSADAYFFRSVVREVMGDAGYPEDIRKALDIDPQRANALKARYLPG